MKLVLKKSSKRPKRRPKVRKKTTAKRVNLPSANSEFLDRTLRLTELFRTHNPQDICVALNVSDLWLPNVASQVRHILAFSVLASMKRAEFTANQGLESYADFCDFIGAVHQLLPTFPMLEDYVPEADWGEIKTSSGNRFLRMFYGCSIERMPDFVEAFKVKYNGLDLPVADLHSALSIQDAIISHIDRSIAGDPSNCAPGHTEIPTEAFWRQCSIAISSIATTGPLKASINEDLIIRLGTLAAPNEVSTFSNSLMDGKLLQGLVLSIDSALYPVSVRNSLGVVIEYWSAREPVRRPISTTTSVAQFLAKRFSETAVLTGPLSIVTPAGELPYRFAGLISFGHRCDFIVVLEDNELASLPRIEREVRRLLSSGQRWGLKQDGLSRIAEMRDNDHNLIGQENVSFVAVTTGISTAPRMMHLPETNAHVLWLPDFLTIFNSIKDLAELSEFWSYIEDAGPKTRFGLAGIVDMFATFRDTHGVLIDGAISPTSIFLDPHWGSSWRYKELKEFWENAPALFPDDAEAGWTTSPPTEGIRRLIAKASPSMSWCTTIAHCVLHFIMQLKTQKLDPTNGRLLELLAQCMADSLFERRAIVEHLQVFKSRRIVTILEAGELHLAGTTDSQASAIKPLFSGWQMTLDSDNSMNITAEVNLSRVQTELVAPKDSQFEVECVTEWIAGIDRLLRIDELPSCAPQLIETRSRTPRFSIAVMHRTIDAPDDRQARIPEPAQYKAARRDLAVTFRDIGISPGRYELAAGKAAIDPARDQFRRDIHARVAQLNRTELLTFCIEQHDALTVEFIRTTSRIQHSLTHQVSFDRSAAVAKAYDDFTGNARNYRYLIEVCLSEQSNGSEHPTSDLIVQLIAKIDWLLVLYDASDVLHNGIEVAGVELNDSFVPEVFYSAGRDKSENSFAREMANLTLGAGLNNEDAVVSPDAEHSIWRDLDIAFEKDVGFSFYSLLNMLEILSRWQTFHDQEDLCLSYTASQREIASALPDAGTEEGARLAEFLILQPSGIRRLIGKSVDEADVPVWDHTKRGYRYTIRPLFPPRPRYVDVGRRCSRASPRNLETIIEERLPARGLSVAKCEASGPNH